MLAPLTTQTRSAIVRLLLTLRGSGLRRAYEATASEESLESRVCSIGIPFGVDGKKYEMDITRGVGLVEPVEGHISLSEPRVDECHRIRRNVRETASSVLSTSRASFVRPSFARR